MNINIRLKHDVFSEVLENKNTEVLKIICILLVKKILKPESGGIEHSFLSEWNLNIKEIHKNKLFL